MGEGRLRAPVSETALDFSTDTPLFDLLKAIYHPMATPLDANMPVQETGSATLTSIQDEGPLNPFP